MAVYTGSCGSNANYRLDTDAGTMEITGTGAMSDYNIQVGKRAPWYSYKTNIRKLTISEGITRIGNAAFYECDSLTDLTIPGTVTHIGVRAFEYAEGLEVLSLPQGVTTLELASFDYCTSLKNVYIPDTVTSVGAGVFMQCNALERVVFFGNAPSLGTSAFSTSQTSDIMIYTKGWGSDNVFTSDVRGYSKLVYKIPLATANVNVLGVPRTYRICVKVDGVWRKAFMAYGMVGGEWRDMGD